MHVHVDEERIKVSFLDGFSLNVWSKKSTILAKNYSSRLQVPVCAHLSRAPLNQVETRIQDLVQGQFSQGNFFLDRVQAGPLFGFLLRRVELKIWNEM